MPDLIFPARKLLLPTKSDTVEVTRSFHLSKLQPVTPSFPCCCRGAQKMCHESHSCSKAMIACSLPHIVSDQFSSAVKISRQPAIFKAQRSLLGLRSVLLLSSDTFNVHGVKEIREEGANRTGVIVIGCVIDPLGIS